MPDFKGSDNLYLVMAFVVPGLIISYVRSQYITGRSKSHTENVVAYVALSLLYYATTLPAIEYVLEMSGSRLAKAFAWLSLIIAGPAVVGLLLGWFTQRGIGRKIAHKLGLNPVHTMPTAWDWKFADVGREGIYLIVTTQQDKKVAGWYGTRSFASSDQTERDLYIEEVLDLDENEQWQERSRRSGILIPSKEIKEIRFCDPDERIDSEREESSPASQG